MVSITSPAFEADWRSSVTVRTTDYTIFQRQCLFVCLVFFVPLENFSLIERRHHDRWRAANFDIRSALMVTEQWGFFSVPHLLWIGHPFIMANALTHCASAAASKTMKLCLYHVLISVLYISIANKMSNYFTYSHSWDYKFTKQSNHSLIIKITRCVCET